MVSYHWPGNIRELLNTIERALIICKNTEIKDIDIILPEKPFKITEDFNFEGNLKQVTSRVTRIIEKIKIERILRDVNFNKTKAADILEISYKTLLDKIKEYGISAED